MKSLLSAVFVLTFTSLSGVQASGGAGSVRAALPAGATSVRASAIRGNAGVYAVSYQTSKPFLAVVDATHRHVLWSRRLPARANNLASPGPRGLFQAIVKLKAPAEAIFAYQFQHGKVLSGIVGASGGEVTGNEGISLQAGRVTVRRRDLAHVGSVRYRLETLYAWSSSGYRQDKTVRVPDYAPSSYPTPNAVATTSTGNVILLKLEIASTDQQRQLGLMYRTSLDPDSGMIFVWDHLVQDSFWMYDTYIPLSIAFLDTNGNVLEIQDMAPQTQTLHTPAEHYQFAIEVNQGFFQKNGVKVGDQLQLHLTSTAPR
jgi:uncharacterized protein